MSKHTNSRRAIKYKTCAGWVEAQNPTPAWVTLLPTHPTIDFTYLLTPSTAQVQDIGVKGHTERQPGTPLHCRSENLANLPPMLSNLNLDGVGVRLVLNVISLDTASPLGPYPPPAYSQERRGSRMSSPFAFSLRLIHIRESSDPGRSTAVVAPLLSGAMHCLDRSAPFFSGLERSNPCKRATGDLCISRSPSGEGIEGIDAKRLLEKWVKE